MIALLFAAAVLQACPLNALCAPLVTTQPAASFAKMEADWKSTVRSCFKTGMMTEEKRPLPPHLKEIVRKACFLQPGDLP